MISEVGKKGDKFSDLQPERDRLWCQVTPAVTITPAEHTEEAVVLLCSKAKSTFVFVLDAHVVRNILIITVCVSFFFLLHF